MTATETKTKEPMTNRCNRCRTRIPKTRKTTNALCSACRRATLKTRFVPTERELALMTGKVPARREPSLPSRWVILEDIRTYVRIITCTHRDLHGRKLYRLHYLNQDVRSKQTWTREEIFDAVRKHSGDGGWLKRPPQARHIEHAHKLNLADRETF